jgi:hypothetical protein
VISYYEMNDDDSPMLKYAKRAVAIAIEAQARAAIHHARQVADAHQYLADVLADEKEGEENGKA